MSKLYCIIGESGSGKSTIANKILNKFPEIEQLVYHTTRNKRWYEKDNVDYIFDNQEDFRIHRDRNELVELRQYNTLLDGDGVKSYYTTREDFDKYKDQNLICAASPEQVRSYINSEYVYHDIHCIRLLTDLRHRVAMLIRRCESDDEIKECIRRIYQEQTEFDDNIDFLKENAKKYVEFHNLYDYSGNILEYVRSSLCSN